MHTRGFRTLNQPWGKTRLFLVTAALVLVSFKAAATEPNWWKLDSATPGVKLTIHEKSRQAHDPHYHGKASVAINIAVSGFPKDKDYELWSRWADGLTARIVQLRVNKAGQMEALSPTGKPTGLLERMTFSLGGFAKGEAIYYALVSTDRKVKVFVAFIPFPLEATQKKHKGSE